MFNIWDYWAGRYDRLWVQKYSLKPTREYIIKALSKYKNTEGLRVLDLGCGPGELIRDLTREFKNLDVTGLDFSERMIEISKERNPSAKHLLMDASDLNVLDEEYDITSLRSVIVKLNFFAKFDVINLSLRCNMINCSIVGTTMKLKHLAHSFNSIIIKISLNKGHVLSY
jgi:ubiquinone/menaquinone biosynthesis C-methylase UbiE